MSTGLVVTIVLLLVAVILIVLGLIGLIRPSRYQSLMRRSPSAGAITGLRLISTIEVGVGVAIVLIVVALMGTGVLSLA